MFTGFLFIIIALICLWGMLRAIKERNLFGGGYAFVTLLVCGWFGVMTVWDVLQGGGIPLGE
ncbi:DUF2759 domain-containing protein [Tuberibacillus sp. Marseille-P3662]|uniref:DUF2759 domain-containing protein n=1 Tax=Tuberibacillus sp. Marseille-P3662 TaxID=1965358 RepID=UPI000A1C8EA2|nr:DUF2759 domain-containing protein [Tuberibacillus sp. Marseille-P3662]